ncbi:MAG TPA: carbonic anhydrase family protein [Solirubrobacteraceae bacterium]|nr:carbonic anhydrase family protein [Solirubrobacteraceae bacterium]
MRRRLAGISVTAVLAAGAAFAASGVAASGSTQPTATFSYSGDNGPGFWGQLNPAWEACAGGKGRQSPIDITNVQIDPSLRALNLALKPTPLALINNGHTIEQEYEPGSTLTLGTATYHLQQFHFHALSEHMIGDWRGVMELHAVFKDDAANRIAVVAMLYKIGRPNRFLDELISAGLPQKEGQTVHAPVEVNLADGLTDASAYYTYAGSLTTPPCAENVTWFVLKRPAELSEPQFQAFDKILGDDFRPLQARNGRTVWATAKGGKGLAH